VIGLDDGLGRDMAHDQDQVLFEQLESQASQVHPQPEEDLLPYLVRLITEHRQHADGSPLLIAPSDYRFRDQLLRSEAYEWTSEKRAVGRLAGADVVFVPWEDRPILLVPQGAISLTEFVAKGSRSPLRILVEAVNREDAARSVSEGFRFSQDGDLTEEETIERLATQRVLVDARVAFEMTGDLNDCLAIFWNPQHPPPLPATG
jgi:hypothetical protein